MSVIYIKLYNLSLTARLNYIINLNNRLYNTIYISDTSENIIYIKKIINLNIVIIAETRILKGNIICQ